MKHHPRVSPPFEAGPPGYSDSQRPVPEAIPRGIAAADPLGVAHVLRILRDELEAVMALAGGATIADIGRPAPFDAQAAPRQAPIMSPGSGS
ncbi:MAG: alpha-hydroxy-acid oxidizing protein [Gammaproteobacteria bacterium]|nr:alpha-hydroxy-acid oxidizing protein [Gammaproteobacteria bacterium]